MKRKISFVVLLFILLTAAGCKKCYYCHNSCKVCQDAHFYILVESDLLSTNYYNMYIDSLTSTGLGWTCRDTAFNKEKQDCGQKGNLINNTVSMDEQAGWTCTPVQN